MLAEQRTSVVLPALQEILKPNLIQVINQVISVVNQVIQVVNQVIQVVNQVIQVVNQVVGRWCVFPDIHCLIWGFS